MNAACPCCGYDLAGLGRSTAHLCPECGSDIESATVARAWARRLTTRWCVFYTSPFIALPGVFAAGVGQPFLCFLLGGVFGYRALKLDEELYGSARVGRVPLVLDAFIISLIYTTLTSIVLGVFFAFLLA